MPALYPFQIPATSLLTAFGTGHVRQDIPLATGLDPGFRDEAHRRNWSLDPGHVDICVELIKFNRILPFNIEPHTSESHSEKSPEFAGDFLQKTDGQFG